jgi:hypothetical protein
VAFTLADARDQILAKADSATPVIAATADAADRDTFDHLAQAAFPADGGDCEDLFTRFGKPHIGIDALATPLHKSGAKSVVTVGKESNPTIESKKSSY